MNRNDFVWQLNPTEEDVKRKEWVKQVDEKVKVAFGEHFDYKVLNKAFCAMVPENEVWTVEAVIDPPYIFGRMKDALVFKAKNCVDALAVIPLELEEPKESVAQVMNFE